MCTQTQMVYFQLHRPTSALTEEAQARFTPERSRDFQAASATSR